MYSTLKYHMNYNTTRGSPLVALTKNQCQKCVHFRTALKSVIFLLIVINHWQSGRFFARAISNTVFELNLV